MQELSILKRRIIQILILIFTATVIFVIFTGRNTQQPQLITKGEPNFNKGWFYYDANTNRIPIPSLPAKIPAENNESRIFHELTVAEAEDASLCFYTQHENVTIRLNGKIIYEFNTEAAVKNIISYRAIYNFIKLPPIKYDSTLCIETKAIVPSSAGEYEKMLLGDSTQILFSIVMDHINNFLLGFMFIVSAVFLFGTNHLFSKTNRNDYTLLHLSFLIFFIGLWQLDDSTILLFFTGNLPFLWGMKYVTQLLIPLFTFLFINSIIEKKNKKFLNFLFVLTVSIVSIQYLLQIFGIKAFTNTIFASHIIYLIVCIYVLLALMKEEWLKESKLKYLLIFSMISSITIFAITACSLFANKFFSSLMSFGLSFTFISLILIAYQKKLSLFEAVSKADTYKKLAFIDIATGVNNKTAWYTLVENFGEASPQGEYCLIVFDMNNLKKLNDTYGHLTGDKVIKAFCDCLVKVVDGNGDIYRIGGDEFVCVCYNMYRESIMTMLHDFDMAVENQEEAEHKFTAAYGYEFFTPHTAADFAAALTRADERMYQNKVSMKQARE